MMNNERQNHKYIARISLGRKNGKEKRRYFYTRNAWDAYLKSKQKADMKTSSENKSLPMQTALSKWVNKKQDVNVNEQPERTYKYIGKEQTIASNGKKTWRYFYTEKAYQSYLKGKQLVEDKFKTMKTSLLTSIDKGTKIVEDIITNIEQKDAGKAIITKPSTNISILPNTKVSDISSNIAEIVNRTNKAMDIVKKVSDGVIGPNIAAVTNKVTIKDDNILPLDIQNKKTSKEKDRELVNPNYSTGQYEYTKNCSYCSATYDLRRRGYDVEAAPKSRDTNNTKTVIATWYEDTTTKDFRSYRDIYKENGVDVGDGTYKDYLVDHPEEFTEMLEKELISQGDGARGIIGVTWTGYNSGHAFNYEVENGKVYIVDSQTNEKLKMIDYISRAESVDYLRTDNREPSEAILNAVINRRKNK